MSYDQVLIPVARVNDLPETLAWVEAEGEKETATSTAAALAATLSEAASTEALFSIVPLQATGEALFVPAVYSAAQRARDVVLPAAFAAGYAVYDPQMMVLLDPRTAVSGHLTTQRFGSFPTLSPALIDALLKATGSGDFLVAEREKLWFMQCYDNGDGTFALERRDGAEHDHLATVATSAGQVGDALRGWLTGDDSAYRDLAWEVLTL